MNDSVYYSTQEVPSLSDKVPEFSDVVKAVKTVKPLLSEKAFEDTKNLVSNFQEKMKTYPINISLEAARTLCIAASVDNTININDLPKKDVDNFLSRLPKEHVNVRYLTVSMDETKDFVLEFRKVGDLTMPAEATLHAINPLVSGRVSIPTDMSEFVENVDDDVKKIIEELIGNDAEPVSKPKRKTPPEQLHPQQTVNRNAYEIRSDVLKMAIQWSMVESADETYKKPSTDELLGLAKKFYSFVEQRR